MRSIKSSIVELVAIRVPAVTFGLRDFNSVFTTVTAITTHALSCTFALRVSAFFCLPFYIHYFSPVSESKYPIKGPKSYSSRQECLLTFPTPNPIQTPSLRLGVSHFVTCVSISVSISKSAISLHSVNQYLALAFLFVLAFRFADQSENITKRNDCNR
jgi:hypothetical protein